MRTRIRDKKRLDYITVEADTAAKAMRALQARLGPTPHIEVATRVRRGGFAGFFARERYLLKALREAPGPAQAVSAPVDAPDDVAELSRPVVLEPASADFGAALSAALFGEPEPVGATRMESAPVGVLVADHPAPVAVGPLAGGRSLAAAPGAPGRAADADPLHSIPHLDAPDPQEAAAAGTPQWRLDGPARPVPPGLGRTRWSISALLGAGVPKVIVESAAGLDERDDLGWINAMADALARHCRELPAGPTVFVGSQLERLAGAFDIPIVEAGAVEIPAGSFVTDVPDDPERLDWLARVARRHHLHLAIDGQAPWLHLLVDDPAGVSFTGDAAVVDALYVALTLGAPLGFGSDGGGGLVRVTPIDGALAVRRLVGRR